MEVRLFATLRENREKIIYRDCDDDMDGYALLSKLGIAPEDVAIFLINGRHSKPDALLSQEDIIALFPPVGGG
jgi:molybdopterin converting factor small subunit